MVALTAALQALLLALGLAAYAEGAWEVEAAARRAFVGAAGALVAGTLLATFVPAARMSASQRTIAWATITAALVLAVVGHELGRRLPLPATAFVVAAGAFAGVLALARASGSVRPLLAATPPLALTIAVFFTELHGVRAERVQVSWGDVFAGDLHDPSTLSVGGRFRPSMSVRMRSNEHAYLGARFVTNAQGFRNERDVALAADDEVRVLNLGDSFSTGFELGQDEFLGPLVQRALVPAVRGVRVLNAEVAAPAHALYYLRTHAARLHARVVLLGICANDPLQTEQFFGEGRTFRLDRDGRLLVDPTTPARVPWSATPDLVYPRPATFSASYLRTPRRREALLEGLARFRAFRAIAPPNRTMPSIPFSYVADEERRDGRKRLIDGVVNLAYYRVQPIDRVRATFDGLAKVLRAIAATVAEQGASLVVVLFPQKFQVHPEEWDALCEFWNLVPEDFDLDLPHRRIREECARLGVECVDLGPELGRAAREETGSLYFPLGDIHLNARGTKIAAEVVAERVRPLLVPR